jgi:oxalyl-CoA decarboxylase
MDSNRPVVAPLVGDVRSVVAALTERAEPGSITAPAAWREELDARKAHNSRAMAERLAATPHPMRFHDSLAAVRDVLRDRPDVVLVNEGANTLDVARDVIDMRRPRHRLDSGTWGVMGIGLGYAIGAAVETGAPVVAIEGDSAFGFSGMELETICRYRLPVTVVVLNNGGVYRGDSASALPGDPSPTTLAPHARHEKLIEAFGGTGVHVTTPAELAAALTRALDSGTPTLVDCALDPSAGVESGHLTDLNPQPLSTGPTPR